MSNDHNPSPDPSLSKGGRQRCQADKNNNISGITNRARYLRINATPAERKFWRAISREQLGVKFRRQHPVGPYVLDFYCPKLKLCIELDGDQHGFDAIKQTDAVRTAFLKTKEISVLRFWNIQLFEELEGVLDAVMEEINALQQQRKIPSPYQGEG